jgi:hypothetical protein
MRKGVATKYLWVSLLSVCFLASCGVKPEAKSGGDAYRHMAKEMVLDEWVDGDIAYSDGDRTDWKQLELDGPSKLTLTINVDLADTGVELGVYSRVGVPLGTIEKAEGSAKPAKLVVSARQGGRLCVKIQATGGAATSYSLKASLGESSAGDSDIPDF